MSTVTTKRYALDELAQEVRKLSLSERETLEMLMDADFTKEVVKRSGEVDRARKQHRLLSFDELKKSMRK